MQMNSGGEMEEEKLKVSIEADASSTEEAAKNAIKALERVKKQYQKISKEFSFKLSKEYTQALSATEIDQMVQLRESLGKAMSDITNAIKTDTLDLFDFDIDVGTIDAAETAVDEYDKAVAELNAEIDRHDIEGMSQADTKMFNELTARANKYAATMKALQDKLAIQGFLSKSDEAYMRRLTDSLNTVTATIKNLKNEYFGVGQAAENAGNKIDDSLDKKQLSGMAAAIEEIKNALNGKGFSMENFTKGIKKAVLAMMGIRSAISLITKSMSTYLNQNDELKAKLNGCYYALGSLMAPVLE